MNKVKVFEAIQEAIQDHTNGINQHFYVEDTVLSKDTMKAIIKDISDKQYVYFYVEAYMTFLAKNMRLPRFNELTI